MKIIALAYVLIMVLAIFGTIILMSYRIGSQSPCSEIESLDIKPLQEQPK